MFNLRSESMKIPDFWPALWNLSFFLNSNLLSFPNDFIFFFKKFWHIHSFICSMHLVNVCMGPWSPGDLGHQIITMVTCFAIFASGSGEQKRPQDGASGNTSHNSSLFRSKVNYSSPCLVSMI